MNSCYFFFPALILPVPTPWSEFLTFTLSHIIISALIPRTNQVLLLLTVHHIRPALTKPTPPITITIYRLNCEILFSTYIGFSSITTSIPRDIVPSPVFMGSHMMRTLHSDGVQSLSHGYLYAYVILDIVAPHVMLNVSLFFNLLHCYH